MYNYSLVTEHKTKDKIKIICKEHGVFEQESKSHTYGIGCPICGSRATGKKQRRTLESFVEDSKNIHNNKYDYSLVKYITTDHNVKIICPKHGIFEQSPHSHLMGKGCTKCGYEKNSREFRENNFPFSARETDTTPSKLYYIKIEANNKIYYKIGVTSKSIEERFKVDFRRGTKITQLKSWHYNYGYMAYIRERFIIKKYRRYKTKDSPLFDGNSEVFDVDVLGADLPHILTKDNKD